MLAELSGLETAGVIAAIVVGIGGLIVGVIGLNKAQTTIVSPQPLTVEVIKALHEQFASKPDFDKHLEDFHSKHNIIWNTLRSENQRIGTEVTATREAIAGLEATTELQNQTLAAVTTDIKTILGRLPRNPHER